VHCTCASLRDVATCGVGSDRIARRRRLVRLHHPCSVERFRCAISSRVCRSHLSLSLITSPRLDLGFFFEFYDSRGEPYCLCINKKGGKFTGFATCTSCTRGGGGERGDYPTSNLNSRDKAMNYRVEFTLCPMN
jgi:hypothetical protein